MTNPADSSPAELALDAPYRIGEAAFGALVADLRARGVRSMVEFGAGASSIRLVQALGDLTLLSVESHPGFADEVRSWAVTHGVADRLTVDHRPLRWQRHGAHVYWSYARGPFPDALDAVLVDGPPFWTLRGREACLHHVAPFLRAGARVYLDDGERDDERWIMDNWLAQHPGLRAAPPLPEGHVVLRADVTAALGRPRARRATLADNWGRAASRAWTTARGYGRGARRRLTGGAR